MPHLVATHLTCGDRFYGADKPWIGLYWHVRNGEQIATFEHKWVTGRGVQNPPQQYHGIHNKVSTLIADGRWNEQLVTELFPPRITEQILSMPISSARREDYRYWLFDPKGKYSVREGYKVAIGIYEPPTHHSDHPLKSFWQALWTMSIPPKVRVFWWRTLHDIIPTSVNLRVHHVATTRVCPLCNHENDTTSHALFVCSAVKPCWKMNGAWTILKKVRFLETHNIFSYMKEQQSKHEFKLFAMFTYAIWQERLKQVHTVEGKTMVMNVSWSAALLKDFQKARQVMLISPRLDTSIPSPTTWHPPMVNLMRLDVNAAFNLQSNSFTIGGVIRDHVGQPVLAFGRRIDKPFSVLYGELVAIDAGIRISLENDIPLNLITTDSLLAIQVVMRPEEDLSFVGAFATDIRCLMDQHGEEILNHVRRSTNNVAHSLAFFVVSSPTSFV